MKFPSLYPIRFVLHWEWILEILWCVCRKGEQSSLLLYSLYAISRNEGWEAMTERGRQPQWDIYEAVVLLEGYLETLQGNQPKVRIIRRISVDLRRMAISRGIDIDDVYRNENGISYQIQSMASAYKGEKIYVPATKLFETAVTLYRTNASKYLKILEEAKSMIAAKQNNRDAFLAWAAATLPAQRCKWIEENILKMERLAVALNLISGSIFEITNSAILESIYVAATKNKFFLVKNRKLIKNINEDFKTYMEFCTLKPETKEVVVELEISQSIAEQTKARVEGVYHVVDFDNDESMAFTKPKSISFSGEKLPKPSAWKDVYVNAVSALCKKYPDVFGSLHTLPGGRRLEFCNTSQASRLVAPSIIADDLWAETNYSADGFIKRIRKLLSICGEDYSSIVIEYVRKPEVISEGAPVAIESRSSTEESEFYAYLQNAAKLADRTCYAYVSNIKGAERYAKEHGYASYSLFNKNRAITLATASELYGDPNFIRYNSQQHNRFSAAINKLLESIGAEIPKKVVASLSSDCGQTANSVEANDEIVAVLNQHYEYGFKYESIRELMRFRQFADAMDVALPEDDDALKAVILASGTVIDDKVYCKSDDMLQELQKMIDNIFASGAGVIYYERLFELEQAWMESHVITSSDMLKGYLQKNMEGCSFSKKFLTKGARVSEKEAVTDEIKRVWGTSPSINVHELHNRLPYIPLKNICRVISGNDLFALVAEGKYILIDLFCITEDEREAILDFVEESCEENGFASLTDVPLGDIEEENYELARPAIYSAIYKKILFNKYHINGKILTKEKSKLDAVTLIKHYIKGKDGCTFDEVADKIIELTGGTNRQYAFQALYDDMIRVDKNRFVANRLVNFNVDEIDAVLSGFITGNFRAIRDVTTFSMFPVCGQSWNHYLLESFCYKYSRKYSLHVLNFNDKNAGIIAERDFNKKYSEMLAIALARADVDLLQESIGQYLFDTGYLAKSKYAKLGEIAQRASELRKER